MSIHNLEKMFKPTAVAIIGGPSRSDTIVNTLISNLRRGGFAGKIFPVASARDEFCGFPVFSRLADIGDPVELALIASPLHCVPAAIRACSDVGLAGAVIFSDGGGLSAEERTSFENQIREAASRGSVRIIGPGSSGISYTGVKFSAINAANLPLPGKLAFISQSRAIYHAILDLSIGEQIGFSYFISTGGMLDVDFADLINFLGNDDRVDSIAFYIDRLTNFRKFMSAARAVSRIKPIVALKSGRAGDGGRFEASRRPAAICEDDIYSAAFKRAGIERVNTFAELFDCAELLAKQPRPLASKLVIVTNGRGPGMMAADALADQGAELASLSPEVVAGLRGALAPSWTEGNPVDVGADASPEEFARVIAICLASSEIEALLMIWAPCASVDSNAVAESLVKVLRGKRIPVCAVWLGAADAQRGREVLNRSGIPTFDTPERAIKAFLHMGSYAHNLRMLQEIPEKLPRGLEFDTNAARTIIQRAIDGGGSSLDDHDAKALLGAYGIPFSTGETESSTYRLMIGVRRHPGFGPILFCGAGGTVGEIYRDCALALPPLNRVLARQLIEASRAYQILKEDEDRLPANLLLIEEVLIRLSQLAADFPEVVDLDLEINPWLLQAKTPVATNAAVVVSPPVVAAPQHLVISSYPSQYEIKTVTRGRIEILLRPIKPEDAPLLVELFHSLSPTSVYFRFFSPITELPLSMLTRFTQIDYDRDIVVVASKEVSQREKILGVVRLMSDPDVTSAEFAIAVADAWQKVGVGAALLERSIHIAKEQGLQSIWGVVLPENKGMLALARSHGFAIKRMRGSAEYELRIDLTDPAVPFGIR